MKKHTLTLLGGATAIPASTLRDVLGALLVGARLATRLRVHGGRKHWLDEVCAIAVTSLAGGRIQLEAPAFGPNVRALGGPPDVAHLTVVDCFTDVLSSALTGNRQAVLADRALLEACVRFAHASPEVELSRSDGGAVVLDAAGITTLENLCSVTPGIRAVRVVGDLEAPSASGVVMLRVPSGDQVLGLLEKEPGLQGRRAVISGMAHFGPSGKCLLVDVEHLGPAAPGDEVFEEAPTAQPADFVPTSVPQDEKSGVNAFFGIWPGDETDAELLSALKAIR